MKKIAFVFAAALLMVATASCSEEWFPFHVMYGNGTSVEQEIDVHDFNAIKVLGSMDVYFTQGPESVKLTADENLAEYYDIASESGTLCVSNRKGYTLHHKARTYLTVSAPELNKVNIYGSGDCDIRGAVKTADDFFLNISGSGDINAGGIECKMLSVKITGSGDIEINSVACNAASLSVMGSGNIEVESMTSTALSLTISGSGDANVGCNNAGDITVHITGSGDVNLWGTANSLETKINGSGKIDRRNLLLK